MSETERQKMVSGRLYRPNDPELEAGRAAARDWMAVFNAAFAAPLAERQNLLRSRFAAVGEGVDIRSPFFCDYGFNIRVGSRVFLNFNCVILDVAESRSATTPRSAPRCKSSPPIIRAIRRNGFPASNSAVLSGSVAMSGSAVAQSSCPA